MSRFRALVTGKNDLIIDDLFLQARESLELLYCSGRLEDRRRHIELLKPDIFIICLNDETGEEMSSLSELKRQLTSMDILTVVIGKEEECEMFQKRAIQVADMFLIRPINIEKIKSEILKRMEQIEKEREEYAIMRRKLAQVREKKDKKHVLIIDDDPTMLKLIKEYLADNYTVATAISGKIAYKFLETRETDIILLDYEMPGENGVEVLKNLRKNSKLANIPVIFLTGVTDKAKLIEALALMPQGYLLKPIDREKLLGTIEKYIG